jgi:uncharacterized protein YjiS (DUF1127 family)
LYFLEKEVETRMNIIAVIARRSLLTTASMLLLTLNAYAGDYARDPCAIPDKIAISQAARADLQKQYAALAAKSAQLDGSSEALNQDCKNIHRVVGSPSEVSCARRERDITVALGTHGRNVGAFNQRLTDALQTAIPALQAQMATTRNELARMSRNSQQWQHEIDDWIELGEQARNEARLHAAFAAIDTITDLEHEQLAENIELNEDALTTYKSLYASGQRFIPAEFRTALEHQLTTMRTRRDLLQLFQQLSLTADRTYTLYKPLSEDKSIAGLGQFTVGILRESLLLIQASPEATMTVTALDMAQDSAYGWIAHVVAQHRIKEFNGLQDNELGAINTISRLYISQVNNLKTLKDAMNALLNAACYKS